MFLLRTNNVGIGTGENRTDTSDPGWQRLGGNTNNYRTSVEDTGSLLSVSTKRVAEDNEVVYGYPMVWSGLIYSDGYQYLNANGYSWSTTVNSYQRSYTLRMDTSGNMYPQSSGYRLGGFPVRCVALVLGFLILV